MSPTFVLKEYKRQKDALRQNSKAERTGEQISFIDQVKLFKPLIESQKAIKDK